MPNRAERRAAAKRERRGIPQQYDQTRGRQHAGMVDEYALQAKSQRLQDGTDTEGPWKPTAKTTDVDEEITYNTNPDYRNPSKGLSAPSNARGWFRIVSWVLIALSVIGFFVIMWLPNGAPIWATLTVSIVFAIGVLSLFFVAAKSTRENPNVDANGTAV
ncbi:tripartite tricarboxylate transporter TctB family protein [Bifidobacterium vespertilionis]|uniref:tripartite tricarboxylate transporter TctB family protein n=1 Tax=Bifidobacterium vespertilionis TaxID=2562524 RepID=UPI001BDD9748|nr:tripartite tricarboxylate transporter TctB family protein [Bifidobacterium vespertilionis]MBT1179131.1 tripartite tricarboxylate transporter TctB family protein [Bifidobacterium vespertilionis]